MQRVINTYTGETVRIGEQFLLPGKMYVKVVAFDARTIRFTYDDDRERLVPLTVPLEALGLQWQVVHVLKPWLLMTSDDWIHASNEMKERGGHFAGYLARAYQHADSSNQKPIKQGYGGLFFRFLPMERQEELKGQAK